MLINGTMMHVFPFIWTRGRFSPGLVTSVLLFWPLGAYTMLAAELNAHVLVAAFAVGARLLATPIGFLLLKQRPYFDETHPR